MWYKNTWKVGIRRKFGDKKQIFSFGGWGCEKSKEILWSMGVEFIKSLDEGDTEEMVEGVAKRMCAP